MTNPADVVTDDFETVRKRLRLLNPEFHESDYGWVALENIKRALDTLEAQLAEARAYANQLDTEQQFPTIVAENTRLRQKLAEAQKLSALKRSQVEDRDERIAALERVYDAAWRLAGGHFTLIPDDKRDEDELTKTWDGLLAALDEGSEK